MKHGFLIPVLATVIAFAFVSCAGNKQVGVLTKPTPATTNLPGKEYP